MVVAAIENCACFSFLAPRRADTCSTGAGKPLEAGAAYSSRHLEQEDVLPFVLPFLNIQDVCKVQRSGKGCGPACSNPALWRDLGEVHLAGSTMRRPSGKEELKQVLLDLQKLLDSEAADRPPPRLHQLLELARCCWPRPGAPQSGSFHHGGAHLLAARGAHLRLAALVRFDDATSWVGELPGDAQSTLPVQAMELLVLLCQNSSKAREELCQELLSQYGFMNLSEALQEHGARQTCRLFGVQEEEGMPRFPTLDCGALHAGPEAMLRSVSDLFYELFAERSGLEGAAANRDVLQLEDETSLATKLSGSWCTAMFLGNRRVDSVPGDWQMRFTPDGQVEGSGKDPWGDFSMSGTWRLAAGVALLRKHCEARRYLVDFLVFLVPQEGGAVSMRGLWMFGGQVGGFWAWQGAARELTPPVAMHRMPRAAA